MMKSKKKLHEIDIIRLMFILSFFLVACSFCWIPSIIVVRADTIYAHAGDQENEEEEEERHRAFTGTKEKLTFINFSDQNIQLYWVDTNDPNHKPYRAVIVHPYEVTTTATFSGHVFSYRWGQSRFSHTVLETSNVYPTADNNKSDNRDTEKNENDEDEESDDIVEQIHILGDIVLDSDERRERYESLVSDRMVQKKTETVTVECTTATPPSEARDDVVTGTFRIKVKPYWSPRGAARFLDLVSMKYYDGCALNRIVPKFLTQFGISSNYRLAARYRDKPILDDTNHKIPFRPGYMSYAGNGIDSRTAEVFIVMPDTPRDQLDHFGKNSWETPFGYVETKFLDSVVSKWFSGYGDMTPWGKGPDPQRMYEEDGYTTYLPEQFPNLSYIQSCIIMDDHDLEFEEEMEQLIADQQQRKQEEEEL